MLNMAVTVAESPFTSRSMLDTRCWVISNISKEVERNSTTSSTVPAIPPADVGAAVAFLCSDGARFVTGNTLPVDGALHLVG